MLALVLSLLLHGWLHPQVDDGVGIDPFGGAHASSCLDEGSGMDPNGGPCTQATGEWPWQLSK